MGCGSFIKENFENVISDGENVIAPNTSVSVLSSFLSLVIVLVIVSLVGAYLWNNSVTNVFSGAKKATWVDILGLTVLLKLIL